jgi:hypothetical protein
VLAQDLARERALLELEAERRNVPFITQVHGSSSMATSSAIIVRQNLDHPCLKRKLPNL